MEYRLGGGVFPLISRGNTYQQLGEVVTDELAQVGLVTCTNGRVELPLLWNEGPLHVHGFLQQRGQLCAQRVYGGRRDDTFRSMKLCQEENPSAVMAMMALETSFFRDASQMHLRKHKPSFLFIYFFRIY